VRTGLGDPNEPLAMDDLGRALRALPQMASGPTFRAAVLARAADAAKRRGRRRRRLGVLALGATACTIVFGAWGFEAAKSRAERRASLVGEHRRLLSELDDLRALAARRSQIRLGGDATTDLYLDLATVPADSTAATAQLKAIQTRSHG